MAILNSRKIKKEGVYIGKNVSEAGKKAMIS